jgi:hypothetical protein
MAANTGNTLNGVPVLDQSAGVCNFANGYYTGDGNTGGIVVPIGFTPRFVKLWDMSATPPSTYEWAEGMAATDSVSDIASTTALDTNSFVVSNGTIVTVTEVAYGGNAPGDGTQGTVSVVESSPAPGTPQCTFGTGGASGAPANISTHLYVWIAFG